jgi:hypothetical protein
VVTTIAVMIGLGVVAGVLAGMLGIGGAWLVIPGMVLLLGVDQHVAQGVSLSAIVPIAISGSLIHWRQGTVRMSLVSSIVPSAIPFALLGSWAAGFISAPVLTRVFGAMLLLIGAEMLLGWSDKIAKRPTGQL